MYSSGNRSCQTSHLSHDTHKCRTATHDKAKARLHSGVLCFTLLLLLILLGTSAKADLEARLVSGAKPTLAAEVALGGKEWGPPPPRLEAGTPISGVGPVAGRTPGPSLEGPGCFLAGAFHTGQKVGTRRWNALEEWSSSAVSPGPANREAMADASGESSPYPVQLLWPGLLTPETDPKPLSLASMVE